jgi:hypothetical protein
LVFDSDRLHESVSQRNKKEVSSSPKIYHLYADSDTEKQEWLHSIRKKCHCCPKCTPSDDVPRISLSQPIPLNRRKSSAAGKCGDSKSSMSNLMSTIIGNSQNVFEDSIQPRRNLRLWISEAKDVFNLGVSKGSTVYCTVSINDVKLAKTNAVAMDSSIWVEEMKLSEIPTCHNRLKITIFSVSKNGGASQEMGKPK